MPSFVRILGFLVGRRISEFLLIEQLFSPINNRGVRATRQLTMWCFPKYVPLDRHFGNNVFIAAVLLCYWWPPYGLVMALTIAAGSTIRKTCLLTDWDCTGRRSTKPGWAAKKRVIGSHGETKGRRAKK